MIRSPSDVVERLDQLDTQLSMTKVAKASWGTFDSLVPLKSGSRSLPFVIASERVQQAE